MRSILEPSLIDGGDTHGVPGSRVCLAATRCRSCGRVDFPRRESCSACGVTDPEAAAITGPAQLGARTRVLHQPPDALISAPYDVVIGRFHEGLSIMGLLTPTGAQLAPGCELEVVLVEVDDEHVTYGYRPAGLDQET